MNVDIKKKAILVVDDNQDFAQSLKETFEDRGYRVDLAFSGEEAVSLFARGNYHITFLDVKLPGMDGVECFLHIRKKKPLAKVTMMTGYQVKPLVRKALDYGALKVLNKPFDMEEALALIEEEEPADFVLIKS